MSTQYLAQPFVWRNWPLDVIAIGWAEIVRDRTFVAASIALALVAVTRIAAPGVAMRATLIGAAVAVGALAGELLLIALDLTDERMDTWSVAGRVMQWSGLGLCVAGMYVLWARDRNVHAAARANELQRRAAESALVQTQLQSLRQQIDPHFLFNTLATIRRFGETDDAGGSRLLKHLAAYLRSTMPSERGCTTLGEEVDLVASYLAIVSIRMSGRLAFDLDVPHALRQRPCPSLSIATLVENAVKHGIMRCPEGGRIAIAARASGAMLEVTVTDTGAGLSGSSGGNGIGLSNVRARLRALHGPGASLVIEANAPRGVRATIRMPLAARDAA